MKITTNKQKTPTASATKSNDWFFLGITVVLWLSNRNFLCIFSTLSHQILQRYVHKGKKLIKLIVVTASSFFFLSVTLKNTTVTSILGATALIDVKVPEVFPPG